MDKSTQHAKEKPDVKTASSSTHWGNEHMAAEEQAQQGLSAQLCYSLSVHEYPQQWLKRRGKEKNQEEEDTNETNGRQPCRVRILCNAHILPQKHEMWSREKLFG